MNTGEKLKSLRKQKRMTLEDVATIINVGRATVLKYENGIITNIPSDKIEQLATLFDVSPAYLMGWSDDAQKNVLSAADNSQVDPEIHIVSGMMAMMTKEERQQVVDLVRIVLKNHR